MSPQPPFHWLDLLSLAETLQMQPNDSGFPEARLRTSASRAYYAAFHEAMTIAENEGYIRSNIGDDHIKVPNHFRKTDRGDELKTRRKIGTELDRLRDLRRKADYEDILDRQPLSLAVHAIGSAKTIVKLLDTL